MQVKRQLAKSSWIAYKKEQNLKRESRGYAVRKYLINFFSYLLPSYILALYSISDLKIFTIQVLKYIKLFDFVIFLKYPIIFCCIFIIPYIAVQLEANIDFSSNKKNLMYSLRFISSISNIVDEKRKRFRTFLHQRMDSNTQTDIFSSIAQPKLQMLEILKSIVSFISNIYDDSTIKASLIYCENNNLVNFFLQTDDLPNMTIEVLNSHRTAAKQSLRKKKMIVVNNTTSSKYFWSDDGRSKIKSIICFPIECGNKVEYVLSITSKTCNLFGKINEDIIANYLNEYSQRICLETYLHHLTGDCV